MFIIVIFYIHKDNDIKNSVFTQKVNNIESIKCYIRSKKIEMTNTYVDKLYNILQDMKLKENNNTSNEKKLDVVIIITITQKDGSECEIGLLADSINIDGKVYNTDKNYIEIIEKAFKLRKLR